MFFIIATLLIFLTVFGPQIWVRRVLKKYSAHKPEIPGTGCELAQHLINRFQLTGVTVVEGGAGEDYYDPEVKIISLSPDNYKGYSITAVAVAAHEIGHALQHQEQHKAFLLRQRRMKLAIMIQKGSTIALMVTPIIFLITRVPHSTLLTIFIGLSGFLASLLVQLVNLPVEYDASFNKALPILSQDYLPESDMLAAKKVLKAAALTYVASTLSCLFNIGRWISILRR